MTAIQLPSLEVPEADKQRFTEAEVHSKLFELDMRALGYPARTSTQAVGEWFAEQRQLAVRRLRSRTDRQARGHYDGLYLIGNAPVVLCEIKRYDGLDAPAALTRADGQLRGYARSDDFEIPPPFLLLYCGKPAHTRFYRRRVVAEGSLLGEAEYELLPEPWTWDRIKDAHLRGAFAEEVVDRERLVEILLHHLDSIEDDLRSDVAHAVEIVSRPEPPELLTDFGRWLQDRPHALRRMRALYERKVAEVGRADQRSVVEEMVTQAALNYVSKVFFLSLCEDRNLPGFYRILREFLPQTRALTSPTTATVFMGLLRRKIHDVAGRWKPEEESAYRSLRDELADDIRARVIEQNNWWELIRVAFDLAEERFPLVYREDAYDDFHPGKATVAELVYDLSTKSFEALSNHNIGDIYQHLLASRRRPGRRQQRARLGAFYTPRADVDYMVTKLNLTTDSKLLDPCMGSGHFLLGGYEALAALYRAQGHEGAEAYARIVRQQLFAADIDTFAASLAAIRLFLLDEHGTQAPPNLFVHDMLLHSPERPMQALFSPEALEVDGHETPTPERAVTDRDLDTLGPIDEIEFDCVVGNPPYGARKPDYKVPIYEQLYGQSAKALAAGSVGTGARDTYGMFFVNGIERLREGGRLCLITNDSFRSLISHSPLRRYILDRCKIIEILLTDTKHFEGVSFQFAGMAITTLEKCSDPRERRDHVMRLVDYIRDPADFASPPTEKVTELRQAEYEMLPETPFFVGVPREVFESAKASDELNKVARGRQGLATADDRRFLAGIEHPFSGLTDTIDVAELASEVTEKEEQRHGIPIANPHWVPFAKGEGFGDYWRPAQVAIDWSTDSVAELERRDRLPAGSSRKPRFQNRDFYFTPGLSYSVVSGGRVSARLLPKGWIFGHKGSAIFAEPGTDERFLLGYLNSALATYFMKKIVNATATADIGYLERLPFRQPSPALERSVVENVERIVIKLKADLAANIETERGTIDDAIFELFEIRATRAEVRSFYRTVGKVEAQAAAADGAETE